MNKLAEYISREGYQKKAFAARLGITEQHLRNLTLRNAKPSETLAKLIAHETRGEVCETDFNGETTE